MNERIKELAEQAIEEKQSLDEFIAAVKLNPNGYYGFSIAELEKFAELIVQECSRQVLSTVLLEDCSAAEVLMHASFQLKLHFEVEL